MSNPAPTLNQINAFNATIGTTIDFNIIGGTEVIRSNKIYIYDLSDNSLICTHLYVSTESIHELPPNTSSSIVYASGKSSADFTNNTQYYAQIQTFTDTAGTQGGSGLSIAKLFWCLPTPTLTLGTIPTTISTTSYNVSATYTPNTSGSATNEIQEFQFNLYSAIGALLQTSGVVLYGEGVDLSYNFSGLEVDSTYYVTLDVTTTQGMSVSAQSNTFTVSIDTPTLGEATVVNNACDGYISVTSNLSSEYGGSGSGEIVSFETDSENVFTKLQVDLDPIQDLHGYDAPWVGGAGVNKIPYPYLGTPAPTYITVTDNGDGTVTVNGTTTGTQYYYFFGSFNTAVPDWVKPSTNYCTNIVPTQTGIRTQFILYGKNGATTIVTDSTPTTTPADFTNYRCAIVLQVGAGTYSNVLCKPILVEGATLPASWTPYENICPISGHDEVDVYVTGINVWDEEWEVGGYAGSNGAPWNVMDRIRSKTDHWIAVSPSTTYFMKCPTATVVCYFDTNKSFISSYTPPANNTFTTPQNARYIRFATYVQYGTTYNNDISINYPSTDHEYHAYNGQTYTTTLPSTTYGGTLDLVSGELTVTHGIVTVDSSSGFSVYSTPSATTTVFRKTSAIADTPLESDQICDALEFNSYASNPSIQKPNTFIVGSSKSMFLQFATAQVPDVTALGTFLTSTPLTICYPLATPQTYQLTPQQIQTLLGQNNVWSGNGEIELAYHIPITNLLVKRQDVADVSDDWLTLYSQPITQASDMDFTFIDFLNQYGKTYKYALVPLLTQTQSGVVVQIEGGYTVSDNVDSIFDGVYIADQTNVERVKAGVGYGNIDMNQGVGSITPIGSKYPIVITNSQNQYHNGSVRGTIVPNDFYSNGNLSRIDMVNKRDELEQFLTNKRAKIIKDWNGNIWLVMIMSNVNCSFDDNYGMGMVSFSADWLEVGDPTNQQDLYNAGLINVGGV